MGVRIHDVYIIPKKYRNMQIPMIDINEKNESEILNCTLCSQLSFFERFKFFIFSKL